MSVLKYSQGTTTKIMHLALEAAPCALPAYSDAALLASAAAPCTVSLALDAACLALSATPAAAPAGGSCQRAFTEACVTCSRALRVLACAQYRSLGLLATAGCNTSRRRQSHNQTLMQTSPQTLRPITSILLAANVLL